jgi:hypothetical protein
MKHSIGISLPAATNTTVLTVPSGYIAELNFMYLYNDTGSTKTVTAYWEHAHDVSHQIKLLNGVSVTTKEVILYDNLSIVMNQGDKLVVNPETGADMSIIVTFDLRKEIFPLTFDGE